MKKSEILETYFHEFCVWCATMPDAPNKSAIPRTIPELLWWLDHNKPTESNFWEWYVKFKAVNGKGDNDETK